MTFKDVKFDSWEATFAKITELVREEFGRHSELKGSNSLDQYEKDYYDKVMTGRINEVELSAALQKLSKMLALHYGKAPIIIIDEYDTPIQEGYSKDFYDEITGFMRNFFSGGFKDNKNLSYGFLTGILRIAQESIFSGLNNLYVNTILNEKYDSFFGFTYSEVKQLLAYYGVSDKEEELKEWYDGYIFGNSYVYCPWDVMNYLSALKKDRTAKPENYWRNTSHNGILLTFVKQTRFKVKNKFIGLSLSSIKIINTFQNSIKKPTLTTIDKTNIKI